MRKNLTTMKPIILLGLLAFTAVKSVRSPDETVKNYAFKNSEALSYCKSHDFKTDYYFLVDLSVHSGKNRFFVYDFKTGKITDQNLVVHGACDTLSANPKMFEKAKFSNVDDSHCSAIGKYKIGKRDTSGWGIKIKYWLEGLEPTNNNAERREIVLHSWEAVSDKEIFPDYSPISWGCPAVSDAFMLKLDAKLKVAKKPVLLWIVN